LGERAALLPGLVGTFPGAMTPMVLMVLVRESYDGMDGDVDEILDLANESDAGWRCLLPLPIPLLSCKVSGLPTSNAMDVD